MPLTWLEEIKQVSSVGLTVQAQALSLDEIDPNQMLHHPVFFPYMPTESVTLRHIFETDYRPTADRRAWNAAGRKVPIVTPEIEEVTMVPIEAYNAIDEEEMQKLREQAGGNDQTYRNLILANIPDRVVLLVGANYRRAEVDAMVAWATGTVVAKNPSTGATAQTFTIGIDSSRIQTAGTAWDDGGTNAYNDLLSWIQDGEAVMGPILAVKMTRAIYNAVEADAPNILDYGSVGVLATRSEIERRLSDVLGHPLRFIIDERTTDLFTDGGTAYTRTRVWPDQYAAAVPAGGMIGTTWRAPVARAYDLIAAAPEAGIDRRGMTVYYDHENSGKHTKIQCQANWLTLPSERNVWTIDTGVATP